MLPDNAFLTEAPHERWRSPQFRRRVHLLVTAALAASVQMTALHAQSPKLASVYAEMDAASKRFQTATADVERDNYERVVKETTVEKGTMYIQRTGSGLQFGATVAENGTATASRIVSFSNGTLQMYTPAEKQVDVFRSGTRGGSLEAYLALGFGGTSQALTAGWNVTDAGPETLSDGKAQVKTEKLVLVSKDPAVQNTFKQITLWLDPARDVSLKQLFETPSGNQQTATYTNIRLNTKVNTAPYKIPLKGITVVPH